MHECEVLLFYAPGYFNPWHACAARVTVLGVCVCVRLSVCLSAAILALQATRQPMSDTNVFITTRTWKIKADFPETTEFERYAVKTSEKANMHNRTSLPWPIALCTFQRHKKSPWRPCIDSCIGMLSYSVASPCQILRNQLAWRPPVNAYS